MEKYSLTYLKYTYFNIKSQGDMSHINNNSAELAPFLSYIAAESTGNIKV
jgi:hypothetical protein